METTLEKITELLNDVETNDFPFTLKERQLAAKSSAETWEAILNGSIEPFNFQK